MIDRDEAMRELVTMTEDEARDFRKNHDSYVKFAARQTRSHLSALYRQQLADRGIELLSGGPSGKDELINAVVDNLYPLDQLNESIHVLYHAPGESWSACEHCHPHNGADCECALGRVAV